MKTYCSSFFRTQITNYFILDHCIVIIGLSVHSGVVCYFSFTSQPLIRDFLSDFRSTVDIWKVEQSDLIGIKGF